MKKRSAVASKPASSECARYPATTLALCAAYHDCADGALKKPTQRATLGRDGPSATLDEELRFEGVAEQVLVDGAPPRAAGDVVVERVEDTPCLLPTHERDDRPPVGPIPPTPATKRVGVGGKTDPAGGIIAHVGDICAASPVPPRRCR